MQRIFPKNPADFRGIDGCRGGWVMVSLPMGPLGGDPARAVVGVYPRWGALPLGDAAMVAVDMPIGLPDTGRRGCDMQAKKWLGKYNARVFIDLRRPMLQWIGDHARANRWGKDTDEHGVGKQAFALLPKIKEVDDWINPDRQATVREAHPEIAFAHLNGGVVLPNKKKSEGENLRKELLRRVGFTGFDQLLFSIKGKGAKLDDLLDACVMAWTAQRIARQEAGCLCENLVDARGLKMEIWY